MEHIYRICNIFYEQYFSIRTAYTSHTCVGTTWDAWANLEDGYLGYVGKLLNIVLAGGANRPFS